MHTIIQLEVLRRGDLFSGQWVDDRQLTLWCENAAVSDSFSVATNDGLMKTTMDLPVALKGRRVLDRLIVLDS